MVGICNRNYVYRFVPSESHNRYIWSIGGMLFDWRILEPGAIVICRTMRYNGFMWNFRI